MMSLARHALALALLVPAASAAWAQASKERAVGFGNFGSSKEPIKIDANKLDVFDKEGRAVFSGDVVAVQGESTMKCTTMTVFYEQNREGGSQPSAAAQAQGPSESAIKKIDCKGPVTIVSKTQVATGDNATFDRGANKILLNGNAALSDGPNVTRGERVVYDINTGVASIDTKPGGRVRALFVPGSGGPAPTGAGNAKPKP
ncbi:LptA/OstA family protein [Microvirga sp. TS319]|uniref:LptA/OstA family protein n=1 Tax=unclassified Microvirga TaxID=2617746 RepID=UPI00351A0561